MYIPFLIYRYEILNGQRECHFTVQTRTSYKQLHSKQSHDKIITLEDGAKIKWNHTRSTIPSQYLHRTRLKRFFALLIKKDTAARLDQKRYQQR